MAAVPGPDPHGADRAVLRLAAGVAHDTGNLVTIIRGFAELLAAHPGQTPDVADGLREILEATHRVGTLAVDLSVIARRQAISPTPTALPAALQPLLPTLGDALGPSFTLESTLEPATATVLLDPLTLPSLTRHFGIIAAALLPNGGRVTLQTERRAIDVAFRAAHPWAAAATYIAMTLQTHGVGLSADDLAHATEPCYPLMGTRRGVGLSLAVAQGWMALHHGGLTVESPDDGARYALYLPVAA